MASSQEAAYIPMVYGVRKKILQARDAEGKPVVSALEVGVVYRKEVEAGHFYYEVGKYPPLGHRPMLDLTAEDTTDDKIVGAYSIATMADGTKSYEFMRRFEIDKVQNASQTGAKVGRATARRPSASRQEPKGPWADWYPGNVQEDECCGATPRACRSRAT
jgi:recombination protein RecT